MVKKREVSIAVKNQIIGLVKGNRSVRAISRILLLPVSTTHFIVNKWRTTGTILNKSRCGRPRILSLRGQRRLKAIVKRNRWNSLQKITCELRHAWRKYSFNKNCKKKVR